MGIQATIDTHETIRYIHPPMHLRSMNDTDANTLAR